MLKKVDVAQVETLVALSRTTFIETFAEHNTEEDLNNYLAANLTVEKLTAELQNPESVFYFFMDDHHPVGFIKINIGAAQSEAMGETSLEVERIYLLKETKGKGFGRTLIEKAEEIARENGKSKIWLGVWEHNQSALRFYERMGYVIVGEHTFYMGDDPQKDYVMEKVLN
ncbi:GNAT family N-acetyltransferase [Fundicoccus culcitae]|uniref:GNAT family N-acetyltransferase n=1 Tax=Fundicoccus culcitae TaxID=2969821 RepID=A0ABY5P2F1_9LACT|nr:GNAT family N-acetyltransferase [Fundicoccus culcitae]UUX32776.1 GNAT family N-acetyltransferase [Fundicoccus culcitae]